jgi:hypothetical protein
MRVSVDMRAHHDQIRASTRQVGNQHARAGGMIVNLDDHTGRWQRAVGQSTERVHRFGADAERRDAGATVASTRPRDGADAGFRIGDQKTGRTHLLRQLELEAAVHVGAHERIFVTNHDNPVADAVRVPLEILTPAQAEIEHFRDQARRRCRAQKRHA